MKLKIAASQDIATDTAEFCLDSILASDVGSCVTLQELIDNGVILQVRERRILALILMNSFLQLLNGPWLQEYWDGTDISFFQVKNDGCLSFNFRQPFLSACWLKSQGRTNLVKLLEHYHPMPDMVTLARFLLELELQDTRFSPSLVQNLRSDLLKATKLLSALKDLDRNLWGRTLFIESMSACLDMKTYMCASTESAHNLLWDIYRKVVNPLEVNLLSMLGSEATLKNLEELSGVSQSNATLDIESNTELSQASSQK